MASADLMPVSGIPWGESAPFDGISDAEPAVERSSADGGDESLDRVQSRQLRFLSVTGSLILHASLMLILAAWLIPRSVPDRGVVIETAMGTEESTIEPLEIAADEALTETSSDSRTQNLFAVSAVTAATGSEAETDLQELPVGLLAGATDDSGGSTGGTRAKVGFFGLEAEGSSFVFVVDYSGSMEGSRFSRARNELINALDGLTRQQKFFVIFYNHSALPMYISGKRKRLVPASRSALRRARRWISQQTARGGTFPDAALEMALALKPDVVFFLSDGAFQRTARTVAKEANQHGTHIHTIAFEFDGGKLLLKGIAEDNDGRYRFVK